MMKEKWEDGVKAENDEGRGVYETRSKTLQNGINIFEVNIPSH